MTLRWHGYAKRHRDASKHLARGKSSNSAYLQVIAPLPWEFRLRVKFQTACGHTLDEVSLFMVKGDQIRGRIYCHSSSLPSTLLWQKIRAEGNKYRDDNWLSKIPPFANIHKDISVIHLRENPAREIKVETASVGPCRIQVSFMQTSAGIL